MSGDILNRKRLNVWDRGGFSLVEVLIALAIGAVVMAGAVQMFKSNSSAFRLLQYVQDMEQNARVGIDFMARDLRRAGMGLGTNGAPVYKWDNTGNTTDGTAYSQLVTDLTAKSGTDIIEVFYSFLAEPITIPNFNTSAANVDFESKNLIGLPGFNLGISASGIDDVIDPYSILFYECADTTKRCTQNLTSGQFNGAANVNIRVMYNRGTCNDGGVASAPTFQDFMFALISPPSSWAAPGGSDCANRPHDCGATKMDGTPGPDLNGKTVCAVVGTDTYYYVYDDPLEPDNPKLIHYIVGQGREVIANHVEDFQVAMGEDSDGDDLVSSTEWVDVSTNDTATRMIRISLMIRTENTDPNKASEAVPTLENSTITTGLPDQYRRRVMSRTIRLRNMGN